jgi:hypothetical protein
LDAWEDGVRKIHSSVEAAGVEEGKTSGFLGLLLLFSFSSPTLVLFTMYWQDAVVMRYHEKRTPFPGLQ